jgi:hypothetical protein
MSATKNDRAATDEESAPATDATGDVRERAQDQKKTATAPKQDAPSGPLQMSPSQLLQQCRTAATRGDCVSARSLAERIARQDRSYYQANVAKDATIMKCVAAEPAAARAAE